MNQNKNNKAVQLNFNVDIRYDVLSLEFVTATFESCIPLLRSNANLYHGPTGALGLIIILPLILSFPVLFANLRSTITSSGLHVIPMSTLTLGVIRSCAPLHLREATYSVGGEYKYWVVRTQLRKIIHDISEFNYDISDLEAKKVDIAALKYFHSDLSRHLRYLVSSGDSKEFILRIFSILDQSDHLLSAKSSGWGAISSLFATSTDKHLGIRKLFRICDEYIGSGSNLPEIEKVYLYDLICNETFFDFAGMQPMPVSTPSSNCSTLQLHGEPRVEMLRRVILYFQSDTLEEKLAPRFLSESQTGYQNQISERQNRLIKENKDKGFTPFTDFSDSTPYEKK